MEQFSAFDNVETIKIENPVDKIIRQIRNLITTGQLKPGDRLPAERLLAEKFGVGRGYIREAILKLEFYGLLKTSPQSGTYVSGYNVKIIDSIFKDIFNLHKGDFPSLIEARYYLEINSAKLAAERRTENDIRQMEMALAEFEVKINNGLDAIDEDLLFHIKVAEATKNAVIESMILILIPELINLKTRMGLDLDKERNYTFDQHRKILNAIIAQDADKAERAMAAHLKVVMENRNHIILHSLQTV